MEIDNAKSVMTNNLEARDEKYKIKITQQAVKLTSVKFESQINS